LIDESLGNWALNLLESFLLIFTGGVWDVHLGFNALDAKVVGQRLLRASNTFIGPFSKKHWLNSETAGCIFSYIAKKGQIFRPKYQF